MSTPSMDDKYIPSPPSRNSAQYEADKAAGINPVGKPYDRKSLSEEEAEKKQEQK